jgi:hypothetical protein
MTKVTIASIALLLSTQAFADIALLNFNKQDNRNFYQATSTIPVQGSSTRLIHTHNGDLNLRAIGNFKKSGLACKNYKLTKGSMIVSTGTMCNIDEHEWVFQPNK